MAGGFSFVQDCARIAEIEGCRVTDLGVLRLSVLASQSNGPICYAGNCQPDGVFSLPATALMQALQIQASAHVPLPVSSIEDSRCGGGGELSVSY
jgi:hypothetical protein